MQNIKIHGFYAKEVFIKSFKRMPVSNIFIKLSIDMQIDLKKYIFKKISRESRRKQ